MVNGHNFPTPTFAAARQQREDLLVVGVRPCRISRPFDLPPTMRGPYGRGWKCDLAAARIEASRGAVPDATVAHWVVEAPWSSEVVHSYSLVLVHLRFQLGAGPVTRYMEGATHELTLWAIHPAAPREHLVQRGIDPSMWLAPPVFGAQVAEPTDAAAEERVRRAVELVCQGRLSPHPAHAGSWAEMFGDNMLRRASSSAALLEDDA